MADNRGASTESCSNGEGGERGGKPGSIEPSTDNGGNAITYCAFAEKFDGTIWEPYNY